MQTAPKVECPAQCLAERLRAEGYSVAITSGVIGTREYVLASSQAAERGLRPSADEDVEIDMCFQHAA